MEKNIGEQIDEISKMVSDEDFIESASNEELMTYLVMVEKLKRQLEKIFEMGK